MKESMKEQLQVRPGRFREVWGGPGEGGENKKAGAAGQSQNTEAAANVERTPDHRLRRRGEGRLLVTSPGYADWKPGGRS